MELKNSYYQNEYIVNNIIESVIYSRTRTIELT